jgi:two-component system sensor kinase FixL
VREAIAMVRAGTQPTPSIDLHVEPSLPEVLADPVQIQQVVINLLLNGFEAMKATDAGHASLVVRVAMSGMGTVTTSVTDAGKGLDGMTNEELFSPFFTTKDQGMGIGLSISRSIVESHDGRIWAESPAGSGASFAFSLPVADGNG